MDRRGSCCRGSARGAGQCASRLGPFLWPDSAAPSLHPSILPVMMETLPSVTNCLLGRESHKCHGVNTCGSNNDATLDMTAAVPVQRLLLLCLKASVLQRGFGGAFMACNQINNVRSMQQHGWCSGHFASVALQQIPREQLLFTPAGASVTHSSLNTCFRLGRAGPGQAGVSAGETRQPRDLNPPQRIIKIFIIMSRSE